MEVPSPLYAKLEQERFFGYLSENEYYMILIALKDENCKIKEEVIHGEDGKLTIRWEIRLVRNFEVPPA